MRLIGLAVLLAVTACTMPNSAEPGASEVIDRGGVAKIAEAPDGTILWGVRSRGGYVYFSSSGTTYSEGCGKNCTRVVEIPNSVPIAK
jgi:hypothetical protein